MAMPYKEKDELGRTVIRNAPVQASRGISPMTEKQKRFAEEYMRSGNMYQAFVVGYAQNKTIKDLTISEKRKSNQLLKNKKIKDYIESKQEINAIANDIEVLGLKQIRGFWTSIIQNAEASLRDKLKASELLARSQGMFLDRVEHSMKVEVIFDGEEKDWNEIIEAEIIDDSNVN
jgi:phage terminase small subunit